MAYIQKNNKLLSFVALNISHSSPIVFARSTFLLSPIIKRADPLEKPDSECVRDSSSCATVEYLTMGPAISCGNRATYVASLIKLF